MGEVKNCSNYLNTIQRTIKIVHKEESISSRKGYSLCIQCYSLFKKAGKLNSPGVNIKFPIKLVLRFYYLKKKYPVTIF